MIFNITQKKLKPSIFLNKMDDFNLVTTRLQICGSSWCWEYGKPASCFSVFSCWHWVLVLRKILLRIGAHIPSSRLAGADFHNVSYSVQCSHQHYPKTYSVQDNMEWSQYTSKGHRRQEFVLWTISSDTHLSVFLTGLISQSSKEHLIFPLKSILSRI